MSAQRLERRPTRCRLGLVAVVPLLFGCRSAARTTSDGRTDGAPASPGTGAAARPAGADGLEVHLAALRARTPSEFPVVPAPPFVVTGDLPPARVEEYAATVRWTVRMLRQDFFQVGPERLIDVWLFGDEASYRAWAWTLFRDRPSTPYGYFSPSENALIMNIATGGGTLVHELVHPLLHADFPGVPPWLNEGLASLFEQCGEEDGHIVGSTNWRLAGLQKAIRQKRTYPFDDLLRLTNDDFYVHGTGRETAQARYLCYYLQQRDLLLRFYREFRGRRDRDPTGGETLKAVLGETSLAAFQPRWEEFVLGLTFP